MNKTMSKTTKALIVNIVIVATLVVLYINGTQLLVLLIAGGVCLTAFNVSLRISKPKG